MPKINSQSQLAEPGAADASLSLDACPATAAAAAARADRSASAASEAGVASRSLGRLSPFEGTGAFEERVERGLGASAPAQIERTPPLWRGGANSSGYASAAAPNGISPPTGVLAMRCVCCGPCRLLCVWGVPCGGKHILITGNSPPTRLGSLSRLSPPTRPTSPSRLSAGPRLLARGQAGVAPRRLDGRAHLRVSRGGGGARGDQQ